MFTKIRSVLTLLLIILIGCNTSPQNDYKYRLPEKINDGLEVSSLFAQGIDSSRIIEVNNLILDKRFTKIHSLLIVKNGKLVLEEYYNGYHRNKKHDLRSVTKSVISALIGIAIDQNAIKTVDGEMFSYFPDYLQLSDEKKAQIKLYHLLTMTSGFKWNETSNSYASGKNSERQRYRNGNWIKFILERDMKAVPGEVFTYCGGCPVLLSAIIGKTTGKRSKIFAEEFLFKPLGIANFSWHNDSMGITDGASGLRMLPRDMAKFGLLFLNGGKWQGEQIIPEKWIRQSQKMHVNFNSKSGYGYLWWLRTIKIKGKELEYFYGSGNGGQKIMVCPALKMVVILTGGNYEKALAHKQASQIINNYILMAVVK